MLLEIRDIKLPIEEDEKNLSLWVGKKLKISPKNIKNLKILRKSLDARKKDTLYFIYSIIAEVEGLNNKSRLINGKDILIYNEEGEEKIEYGYKQIINRPVIIGSGPAGLFAGLFLAENGYKPLILERGGDVDSRSKAVDKFFKSGEFDACTNIQFGEGGAGTFSDGKLTTRIKDKRVDLVLKRLVDAGAPEEILYLNKPHIGTDILKEVVKRMRSKIIELGGEVRFFSKVTDIEIEDGKAKSVTVNGREKIESNIIIAALGHSARDTYKMLFEKGVRILPKPFSIGVRIEHLQSMINEAQYGRFAGHPKLGAADYVLTFRSKTSGRSAYSFCMCPGGTVVAAASEENMVVTNGMSEYKRDKENANSALVVSVSPEDFGSLHPLAGVDYQRIWEKKAYELGGGLYYAPIQLAGDFLKGTVSSRLGKIKPSYAPGTRLSNLEGCLPSYVVSTMREALQDFDRKIKGFSSEDAVLTGVETRTSAPVRIVRNEDMESENTENLYPIGEGAGYAGGIVSAAVDGIKAAERIMRKYEPLC